MKVFFNDNTINTMNYLVGQNNQKLIMGGILKGQLNKYLVTNGEYPIYHLLFTRG
jgi:hypothetical protein